MTLMVTKCFKLSYLKFIYMPEKDSWRHIARKRDVTTSPPAKKKTRDVTHSCWRHTPGRAASWYKSSHSDQRRSRWESCRGKGRCPRCWTCPCPAGTLPTMPNNIPPLARDCWQRRLGKNDDVSVMSSIWGGVMFFLIWFNGNHHHCYDYEDEMIVIEWTIIPTVIMKMEIINILNNHWTDTLNQ